MDATALAAEQELPESTEYVQNEDPAGSAGDTENVEKTELSAETEDTTEEEPKKTESSKSEETTESLEEGSDEDSAKEVKKDENPVDTYADKTITLNNSEQYIEEAGTYTINGVNLSGVTAGNLLIIRNTQTTDEIVWNIDGDIEIADKYAIFAVTSPCDLTINGNGHKIKNSEGHNRQANNVLATALDANAIITLKGGEYESLDTAFAIQSGSFQLQDVKVTGQVLTRGERQYNN